MREREGLGTVRQWRRGDRDAGKRELDGETDRQMDR